MMKDLMLNKWIKCEFAATNFCIKIFPMTIAAYPAKYFNHRDIIDKGDMP